MSFSIKKSSKIVDVSADVSSISTDVTSLESKVDIVSSFPSSIDAGVADPISKLQAKVGVDGSAVATSLDYIVNSGQVNNAATADRWTTARTVSLTGAVTGSASLDGSGNVSISTSSSASPGSVLISSTSVGSSASSITVSNCFSSTYDDYLIVWTGGRFNNSSGDIRMTLTASGQYNWGLLGTSFPNYAPSNYNGIFVTHWVVGKISGYVSPYYTTLHIFVSNPYKSMPTTMWTQNVSDLWLAHGGGIHAGTSASTGFTLSTSVSTFNGGTVRVYGYDK